MGLTPGTPVPAQGQVTGARPLQLGLEPALFSAAGCSRVTWKNRNRGVEPGSPPAKLLAVSVSLVIQKKSDGLVRSPA